MVDITYENYKVMQSKLNEAIENRGLNEKQKEALIAMVEGKNVFLTGKPGTGKSYVVGIYREIMKNTRNVGLTSTTGISAILIGGSTLHSFLKIGLGQGSAEFLAEKILKNTKAKNKWLTLDTLIIDEVSMLAPDLLTKLEEIARIVRRKNPKSLLTSTGDEKPFGGIQLILSGDFLQLPVVGSDSFCFETETWDKCIEKVIYLTDIIRQTNKEFIEVLDDARYGKITKRLIKLLSSRIGVKLENKDGIKPTKVFTTNTDVDYLNEEELDKLASEEDFYQYDMKINFRTDVRDREYILEKWKKSSPVPDTLQLCKGAQVMLLVNLDTDNGLANGSRGIVVGFCDSIPVVKFLNDVETLIDIYNWEVEEDGKKQITITQIPLKLAWATTVHKIQGATLDYAELDLSNIFAYGQASVALSRVRTLEGLSISKINFDGIKAHPRAIEFYKKLE